MPRCLFLTSLLSPFACWAASFGPIATDTFLDGEGVFPAPVLQVLPSANAFGFRVDFTGTCSNSVDASLGEDVDGSGRLSFRETDVRVGWDCGRYFIERPQYGIRWEFAATNDQAVSRWLYYKVGLYGTNLVSFSLLSDEGELKPAIPVLDIQKHTISWAFEAHNQAAHIGELMAFSKDETLSDRHLQTDTTDPYGTVLGIPYCPFSLSKYGDGSAQLEIRSDPPRLHIDGSNRGEYGSLHRFSTRLYGHGTLSFAWRMTRVPDWMAPTFSFAVDGGTVASCGNNTGAWERVSYTIPETRYPTPPDGQAWRYTYVDLDPNEAAEHTLAWHAWTQYYSSDYSTDIADVRYTDGLLPQGTTVASPFSTALRCPEVSLSTRGNANWQWSVNTETVGRKGTFLRATASGYDYRTTETYLQTVFKGMGLFVFEGGNGMPYYVGHASQFEVDGTGVVGLPARTRDTLVVFIPQKNVDNIWPWRKTWNRVDISARGRGPVVSGGSYGITQSAGVIQLK